MHALKVRKEGESHLTDNMPRNEGGRQIVARSQMSVAILLLKLQRLVRTSLPDCGGKGQEKGLEAQSVYLGCSCCSVSAKCLTMLAWIEH